MSDIFFSTMERLLPSLRSGDLNRCGDAVARQLRKLPATPFHLVLDLAITNDPEHAAHHFDRFFGRESERFPIAAAYTEMNGFDINPDRWYCDLFAYEEEGGDEDRDWLSDWQSQPVDAYAIKGLEALQQVYASKAFSDKKNLDASYLCSLMVVIKFQQFIQRAATCMKALQFPLYVTAHDFDFIARFDVRPKSRRRPAPRKSADELVSALIASLDDADGNKRFHAVTRLYSLGAKAKRAVPSLIARLDDPDPATRQFAASALAQIDPLSDTVVSALVVKLRQDERSEMREEIVRSLSNSPTKESINALSKALLDPDRDVRHYSVISLKVLGKKAKAAMRAIEKLLETETDAGIRMQATTALRLLRK